MIRLRVGCSGWQYRHWRGTFYPPDLPASRWLSHYTRVFDTVEINNTFYRLPERETFAAWHDALPRGFTAAIKASRFLTHMKRLLDPEEPIARLFDRASALGPRLGPILYQLPAAMTYDLPRLDRFLRALPTYLRPSDGGRRQALLHAIEFRHPSWYAPEAFDRLARAGVALCLHDRAGSAISGTVVGPFVYVRYHGSTGDYRGSYSRDALQRQADWLVERHASGLPVYAYFNNDIGGAAPANALTLREAIARRASLTA